MDVMRTLAWNVRANHNHPVMPGVGHTGLSVLDRHQQRRHRKIPTLSVLIGRLDVTRSCWDVWTQQVLGCRVLVVAPDECSALPAQVIRAWATQHDVIQALKQAAWRRLSTASGRTVVELRAAMARAGDLEWSRLQTRTAQSQVIIDLARGAVTNLADDGADSSLLSAFAELFELLDDADTIGVSVWIEASNATKFDALAQALLPLVDAVPRLPVGLAAKTRGQALAGGGDTRAAMLLREGLVVVEHAEPQARPTTAPEDAEAERLNSTLDRLVIEHPGRFESVSTFLTELGASAAVEAAFADAAQAWVEATLTQTARSWFETALVDATRAWVEVEAEPQESMGPVGVAGSNEALGRARSKAELAVFRLLESLPQTRGLFRLNEKMPFRFGPRPAEIDLFSRDLGLCLEIDGPHHFLGPQRYRRDRRKDILLQAHGFWILRILARDVTHRPSEVRHRILDTVAKRRRVLQDTLSESEEASP